MMFSLSTFAGYDCLREASSAGAPNHYIVSKACRCHCVSFGSVAFQALSHSRSLITSTEVDCVLSRVSIPSPTHTRTSQFDSRNQTSTVESEAQTENKKNPTEGAPELVSEVPLDGSIARTFATVPFRVNLYIKQRDPNDLVGPVMELEAIKLKRPAT